MDMGLSGRVALITGGGDTIGPLITRLLICEGTSAALLDLNCETAAQAKQAENTTATIFSDACDITDETSVAEAA